MNNSLYISKIEIKNYRSCVSTTFEPASDLSALIGPNGSGKTNVLSALQLLSYVAHVNNPFRRKRKEPFSSDSEIKVHFNLRGNLIVYEAEISLVNNERNEDEVLNVNESWYMHSITKSRKKLGIPVAYLLEELEYAHGARMQGILDELISTRYPKASTSAVIGALREVAKFLKSISYYSASLFTNPSSCPISFEVESESGWQRGISISGHKKFLYNLYTAHKRNSSDYHQFIDIVGPNGINLIDDLVFQEIETSSSTYQVAVGGRITTKEKKNKLIIPNFKISGNALSPSQLSEGTFRTLALVFYLITDRTSLMLIEEPEVCIHHGLLSSIIQLIKAYSEEKQIIISTHSDQLLDQLDMESVFKVTKEEIGTSVTSIAKSLNSEELMALKDYLRNEGGLGEYWKYGEL